MDKLKELELYVALLKDKFSQMRMALLGSLLLNAGLIAMIGILLTFH